jgi:hydroxymethylbilane synthase
MESAIIQGNESVMALPITLRLGTRSSALALTQAGQIRDRLESAHPGLRVELVHIKTRGDKILDVPLAKVGGKGLFVKEIEDGLLEGRVDLAVHSMKDVPVDLPEGLFIAAVPIREDHRDVLISKDGRGLDELAPGARVGTSSLRRQAQLLARRQDLDILMLRGNLDTRLRKLAEGGYEAIVVAAAGLSRMGLLGRATQFLDPGVMLPAIGQGALGIEARRNDPVTVPLLAVLHHPETAVAVAAERSFLATLEGGCQVPLAAWACLDGDRLHILGLVADPEGNRVIQGEASGPADQAETLGRDLAMDLLHRGGRAILDELYRTVGE